MFSHTAAVLGTDLPSRGDFATLNTTQGQVTWVNLQYYLKRFTK